MNKIPYNPPTYVKGEENQDKRRKKFIKIGKRPQTRGSKIKDRDNRLFKDEKEEIRKSSSKSDDTINDVSRIDSKKENQWNKSRTNFSKDFRAYRKLIVEETSEILFKKRQIPISNCLDSLIQYEGKCQRRYSDGAIIIKKSLNVNRRFKTACFSSTRKHLHNVLVSLTKTYIHAYNSINISYFFL